MIADYTPPLSQMLEEIAQLKAENARLQSTRLDMFAAAAMQGAITRFGFHPPGEGMERTAILCFEQARAMIAEGEKP